MSGKNMENPDTANIRKEMEAVLSAKRYAHTLGVAYTAAALSMAHGEDMANAMTAGLLRQWNAAIRRRFYTLKPAPTWRNISTA